ncbi:MAG: Gfo/Idh/MocA family oxidoreductase [Armatimonadetes bacterium]|nr:Gfo/Idh/MocA family oxidoreductase [Armatimonadota bacterium]
MSQQKLTRRDFIAGSAAGIAAGALSAGPAAARVIGANDRLSIGIIGAGGQGRYQMSQIIGLADSMNAEITAVCDVWRVSMNAAVDMVKKKWGREPRKFTNYNSLLSRKDIDAVIIATPDYHHSRILAKAVRAGKDVYCEKPMASDFADAREALEATLETGRVVQIGTQRRSDGRHKAGAEFVRSGALGKISRVECAWNDCGPRWRKDVSNAKAEDVNWRMFLDGLEDRPFDPHFFREWQLYRDLSIGTIGLLGSHMIDVVHWFMDDALPTAAVASGGNFAWNDGRENEDTMYALIEYPKGWVLRYCTGLGNALGNNCYFFGTNGTFDTNTWKVTGGGGSGSDKIAGETEIKPVGGENHMQNFLECVRSRKQPNADIHAGYAHAVASLLGGLALRKGRRMVYDAAKREISEG